MIGPKSSPEPKAVYQIIGYAIGLGILSVIITIFWLVAEIFTSDIQPKIQVTPHIGLAVRPNGEVVKYEWASVELTYMGATERMEIFRDEELSPGENRKDAEIYALDLAQRISEYKILHKR